MPKRPKLQTRPGLLPEAARLVLPAGIVSTGAPSRIAVAAKLGIDLDPWQADVSRILWAKLSDSSPAADTVCLSIPRQAGKTYLVAANMVAECLISADTTVAWTAHHNKVMLETFDSLRILAQQPLVAPHVRKINASAENRSILFTNGSRIVMAARESGALRGVAKVRILVLDEAQILSDSAMADVLPTQNQVRGAITVMMGTPPKPKDPSEVWVRLRDAALKAERVGKPLDLAAWIEFAADSDAETDDHAQWRKANPSYPKRTPLRAIRKLRAGLTEDHFRREALGIWDDQSTPAVIPPDTWAVLVDEQSKPAKRLVLGIDISPLRTMTSVALAGLRDDELVHVELYEQRAGVDWVVDWVCERVERNQIAGVVIDQKSPAASLLPAFKARRVRITTTTSDDMANSCAEFFDAVMAGRVRHIGQPQMASAVDAGRRRSIGERWAWNRKNSESDITPLVAATLACWGVGSHKVRRERRKGVVLSW